MEKLQVSYESLGTDFQTTPMLKIGEQMRSILISMETELLSDSVYYSFCDLVRDLKKSNHGSHKSN